VKHGNFVLHKLICGRFVIKWFELVVCMGIHEMDRKLKMEKQNGTYSVGE
jgi:hypothetical protein